MRYANGATAVEPITPTFSLCLHAGHRIECRAADGLRKVLFTVLASAAELLASDRLGRIRECGSADCTWLFVDESRNRSGGSSFVKIPGFAPR